LVNLLDNALRYTPGGGTISLSARRTQEGVAIEVKDTGPGIPPEDLSHLFERFYRGDKSRQREQGGSGLGLAIAKSLVESQGGQMRVESKPGEGATFIIELPAHPE
jgi:two-component system phosphate regulon sensor histidine kinase PhoR